MKPCSQRLLLTHFHYGLKKSLHIKIFSIMLTHSFPEFRCFQRLSQYSCALLFASALAVQGQSVGVGFHLVELPQGSSLISNPFQSGSNLVSSLFSDVPDGFTVSKLVNSEWQGSMWTADSASWSVPEMTLTPGEGARVDSPEPYQWFTSGKPLVGSLVNWVPAGDSVKASRLALAGLIESELGLQVPEGTLATLGVYVNAETGWLWTSGEEFSLGVGEAIIISSSSAFDWTQTFDVEGVENPLSLTQVPSEQTLVEGSSLSMEALAEGADDLAYQWQKDGVDIPGANSAVLSIESVALTDSGQYAVIASSDGSAVRSLPVSISVEPKVVEPPASPALTIAVDGRLIEVTIIGEVGQSYQLQGTEDFQTWFDRGGVLVNENGTVTFRDRVSRGKGRYYRAIVLE
jgi:hypothetical protein